MDNSIGGFHIKLNNIGTARSGLDLNEIVLISGDVNLLSPSCLQVSCARRNVLPLNGGGHHMPQQHLGQLLLILQKTTQSLLRDLQKSVNPP